jgi:Right handed beta helix region
MRLRAQDFSSGSQTGGIQEAIAALPTGAYGEVLVDAAISLATTINLARPATKLILQAPLQFPGVAATFGGVGIQISAAGCEVAGEGPNAVIMGPGCAGIMLLGGADNCVLRGLTIGNYNTTNTNGQAAIFAYGCDSKGNPCPINHLRIENCQTGPGNGNGIRLGPVIDCDVVGNLVQNTGGQSAEGITAFGTNIRIVRNRVSKAYTTGILLYSGPIQNVLIAENIISDSSQATALAPTGPDAGTHSAIELCTMDSTQSAISIIGNIAYDDQASPTQQNLLLITGNTDGTLQHLRVVGNNQWGCVQASQMVSSFPGTLIDIITQ